MDEKAFFEKLGSTLDAAILKIKNFSRLTTENMVLTSVDGKELNLGKESGEPAVGDPASPDGEYKMANGQTITVADGVITEISEDDPMAKAMERIAELEAELEAAKAEKADAAAAEASFRQAEAEAKALVDDLSKLRNEWKPPTRSKVGSSENKIGRVDLTKVAEVTEKIINAKKE